MSYGYLIFRNNSTRTEEISFSPENLGESDFAIIWDPVDDDYYAYNYLRNPDTGLLSRSPIIQNSSEISDFNKLTDKFLSHPNSNFELYPLFLALSSFGNNSNARAVFWEKVKLNAPRWLTRPWIDTIEAWCKTAKFGVVDEPPVYNSQFLTISQSQRFESIEYEIVVGGYISVPHRLKINEVPTRPVKYGFYLVCKTKEYGFSVGDRLDNSFVTGAAGNATKGDGITVISTSTEIKARFSNQSTKTFAAHHLVTGNYENLTNSNWKIVLWAEL
jgi:hypothetical protein